MSVAEILPAVAVVLFVTARLDTVDIAALLDTPEAVVAGWIARRDEIVGAAAAAATRGRTS